MFGFTPFSMLWHTEFTLTCTVFSYCSLKQDFFSNTSGREQCNTRENAIFQQNLALQIHYILMCLLLPSPVLHLAITEELIFMVMSNVNQSRASIFLRYFSNWTVNVDHCVTGVRFLQSNRLFPN